MTSLHQAALRRLSAAAVAALHATAARAAAPADTELRESAELLTVLAATAAWEPLTRSDGSELPVCRHWPTARAEAALGPVAEIGRALATLGPSLHWAQNPNYRRQPPHPAFLHGYGYAVLAGPAAGPPPLLRAERLALGVLILAPCTLYPLHHHPAIEQYVVLSGDGEWWRGPGPWRRHPAGAVVHHSPHVPHAMRAGPRPLLALYLWRGELATHARLS
jgi:quercetin dioxygenase-like cupin family protein